MSEKWSDAKKRSVAAQFFVIFSDSSPERIETLLNGRISKSTIRRDRDGLKTGAAPSLNSARIYAAYMQLPDGHNTETPEGLEALANAIAEGRKNFQASIPMGDVFLNETAKLPSFWARMMMRFEAQSWTNVIDILEPVLDEDIKAFRKSDAAETEIYLRQYLGIALIRTGSYAGAMKHFKTGLDLAKDNPLRKDARYVLAIDYCFLLLQRQKDGDFEEIFKLLKLISNEDPPAEIAALNFLIIAGQLGLDKFAWACTILSEKLRTTNKKLNFTHLRSILLSDEELKIFQNDDIFNALIETVDLRVRNQGGESTSHEH